VRDQPYDNAFVSSATWDRQALKYSMSDCTKQHKYVNRAVGQYSQPTLYYTLGGIRW